MGLPPGIYEQLINMHIAEKLSEISSDSFEYQCADIRNYDTTTLISLYLTHIFRRAFASQKESHTKESSFSADDQIKTANALITTLAEITGDSGLNQCRIHTDGEVLLSVIDKTLSDSYGTSVIPRPDTSLALSSLFTGSHIEPSMVSELKKEIQSADRIDILVSFVKWSGIRLIIDDLREFTRHGTLRVITTSYIGATDIKAVASLSSLENSTVRISYDTKRTRLHAKAYHFHRNTGFSTVYVGSSNLSNAAVTSGLEWNVKLTAQDAPDILRKVEATFETYWNDPEFHLYRPEDAEYLKRALESERHRDADPGFLQPFDIRPYYYQTEILDKLRAERELFGRTKNLIVAATGTGKTVIAAFDYQAYARNTGGHPRLLYVAHREEILTQSCATFRGVLRDQNFGELLVGRHTPTGKDHLFISIQSFNSRELYKETSPDYYDYIVIDEFHHAAAPSYAELLSFYRPKILLGLTATPERMDGHDILSYFDGHVAAEIRLPESIDRKLLAPFHYFGVADGVCLDQTGWTSGRYDVSELNHLYIGNTGRVRTILDAVFRYTTDIRDVIGLGFCVSVNHAAFMAQAFTDAGIPSSHLHAKSKPEERDSIRRRLVKGEISFIFVVDLYNEGVDIPDVNTILFLRPTESLTIFIQQLGRGLRLAEGKECLTVLDFVGRHRAEYRFAEHLEALLYRSSRSLAKQITSGSYALPKGCNIHLERVAQEHILKNISDSIQNKRRLIENIRTFEERSGRDLTLTAFLDYFALTPRDIYEKGTFQELCFGAGIRKKPDEKLAKILKNGILRLISSNSGTFLAYCASFFQKPDTRHPAARIQQDEQRHAMLYYTFYTEPMDTTSAAVHEPFSEFFTHSWMTEEVRGVTDYLLSHLQMVEKPLSLSAGNALSIHGVYTRDQIFAALGEATPACKPSRGLREGVVYLEEIKLDVFFVTLNKTEEHYSPTTMYEDYAISDTLFHWQSQSTTSEDSPTGKRYVDHQKRGTQVLFFVREHKKLNNQTQPYTCLGTATYVRHTGSRPMSIVWQLDTPMPPRMLEKAMKMGV